MNLRFKVMLYMLRIRKCAYHRQAINVVLIAKSSCHLTSKTALNFSNNKHIL